MLSVLRARLQQGYRTAAYPAEPPKLPDRLRGLPSLDPSRCPAGCADCLAVCPTEALGRAARVAAEREDLLLGAEGLRLASALRAESLRLFGRSLKLRQVSAAGCNACEADINVLSTLNFDLGRFGIQVVASPRHADALIVTGPVSRNMKAALLKTYEATPAPKLVIAVGACAISGGVFRDHDEVCNGVGELLHVDLFIPGCPPHPYTILDGLLRLLGKLPS